MQADAEAAPVALALPVRHLGDRAEQMLPCAARRPLARAGTRAGPCRSPARSRRGSSRSRTRCGRCRRRATRQAARRAARRRARRACSGCRTCGTGVPFMTIWSVFGGVPPRAGGHVSRHRLGDHAMVPGDDLAVGVEARLDVMRGRRPELAARDVVLAAPDQLDRLADRLGQPHRIARRPRSASGGRSRRRPSAGAP